MSRPDPDDRPDDLTERYRAASAQDPARPSDAIRQSIFAHARMVAAGQTVARTGPPGTRGRAANDPSWRRAIAASVIVTGLATVLAWHFHARGPVPGQRPDAASWNSGADKRLAAARPAAGAGKPSEPLPPESKASNAPAPNAVTAPSRQRLVAQAESPHTPHAEAPGTAHDETAAFASEAGSAASSREALASVEVTAERNANLAGRVASSESESRITSAQAAAAPATPPSPLEARRSAAPGAAASDRAKAQPAPPLVMAAESGDLGQIEQLLRGGASTEQADARGRTPLLIATLRADLPMVRRLLAAGARADAVDANGDTPLAAARRQGPPELINLLERGTQP